MAAKTQSKKKPKTAVREDDFEDLTFQSSPEATVGIELELQILDRDTGDLAPGAPRLLQACEEEEIPGVSAEMLQSMIEIKSGVCKDVHQLQTELTPQLWRLRTLANSLGYDLAMGATHPFNRPESNSVFPAERYQRIQQRMAWLSSQIVVFGLHVHVGMPSGDLAIGTINKLVEYVPHLLALSANSPFWRGVDTGMGSTRSMLFKLAPNVSLPHYFQNWKKFTQYVEVMRRCRSIHNTKDIRWDIRPRPVQGTIEFRICDMPPTLQHCLALAALIRSLVIGAQRLLQHKPRLQRGDLHRYWIAVENKWLAARFGLEAQCIRTLRSKLKSLGDDVDRMLGVLRPIARESGDEGFLDFFQPVADFETGADRQRRVYRESGDWKAVVNDMKDRWAKDVEVATKRES
jgi:carboxylate-amine ligase